ncbi:hypothetical protein GCM10020001_071140 [Nonomuraea salmonea]
MPPDLRLAQQIGTGDPDLLRSTVKTMTETLRSTGADHLYGADCSSDAKALGARRATATCDCDVRRAPCDVQRATCHPPPATRHLRRTTHDVRCAVCGVRCATCDA